VTAAAIALPVAGQEAGAAPLETPARPDAWHGLKAGVASYTLRKMPTDAAIRAIQRVDLHYASIKDVHLPLNSSPEERRAVARKFREAGITPLSCGNITLSNDEANIRQAFEYARDIGVPTIVCSPHPASMPVLDRMVREYDIRLAIHNHGPEDRRFPSPNEVWNAVQKYDARIGLCIDVGHTARAGVDPAAAVLHYHARLYDLHFKDISSLKPNAGPVEGGRGVLNLKAILQALLRIGYPHLLSFEYEKDADDPLPGLSETVGYSKGLLTCL
jgi:sugar phosphate isomerase/epimerase